MNPAGATDEVRLRRIESTVRIARKPLSWLKRVGGTDREYVRTPVCSWLSVDEPIRVA
jgi:hypothetical protein